MQPMQEPARIRGMFAAIADTYDLLNHLLSANQDRAWRRFTVRAAGVRPGDTVLDVCTGTADMAMELADAVGPNGRAVGTDFCAAMVRRGAVKARDRGNAPRLGVADTLHLPFRDAAFHAVTASFGIRNVADLRAGIDEMVRVTRPGGRVVILELTRPDKPLVQLCYYVYFLIVLPILGNAIAGGRRNAYGYLPRSVLAFPDRHELASVMASCGLEEVKVHALSLGIVTVHVGTRPLSETGPPGNAPPRSAPL